jgi:hypothetical protein
VCVVVVVVTLCTIWLLAAAAFFKLSCILPAAAFPEKKLEELDLVDITGP